MADRVLNEYGLQGALSLSADVLLKPDGTRRTPAEAQAHAASSCSAMVARREQLVTVFFKPDRGAGDAVTRLGRMKCGQGSQAVARALSVLGTSLRAASAFYECFGPEKCRSLISAVLWDQENDVLMEEQEAGDALAPSVRGEWHVPQ